MNCAGCSRVLPTGYLAVVTEYTSVNYSTTSQHLKVQKPTKAFCRPCSDGVAGRPEYRRKTKVPAFNAPEAPEGVVHGVVLSLKELAKKIFPLIPATGEGTSSKRLARLVELGDDEQTLLRIKNILKTLRDAGKVRFDEGRWFRV